MGGYRGGDDELQDGSTTMTRAQQKELERRLLEERQRLEAAIGRYADANADSARAAQAGDLSTYPFHMADIGTDSFDREVEASNIVRQSAELADIEAALTRLYETPERFGRCEVDGQEIPFARLELVPWTRTCRAHAVDG